MVGNPTASSGSEPVESSSRQNITELLQAWRDGDDGAFEELVPLVYDELRRLARAQMRREPADHTLQPTGLVHEAYVRLVGADLDWQDRNHFLSVAARAMRRVLIDHARRKRAERRGGDLLRVTLSRGPTADSGETVDVMALHEALERLEAYDARQARTVELHFFGGLTQPEIAQVAGLSLATVERDLRHARAWLRRELS